MFYVKINGKIIATKGVRPQGDYLLISIRDDDRGTYRLGFKWPNAQYAALARLASLVTGAEFYDFDAHKYDEPKKFGTRH